MTASQPIGKNPNAFHPPVRTGRRVRYPHLDALRTAMVQDDIALIDGIANRRRRDLLIVEELAEAGVTPDPSWLACTQVPEIAEQKYPNETHLRGLVEVVYVELAPEDSVAQLYDYAIVHAIAARLRKAKDATVFKWDRHEGIAPAQQALNRARAVALAADLHPEDAGLAEVVDRVYGVLVPQTVAIQQLEFANTTAIMPSSLDFLDFGVVAPGV